MQAPPFPPPLRPRVHKMILCPQIPCLFRDVFSTAVDNSFIETLRNLVKDLPESAPEASEFDRLAVFGGNPEEFDDPTLDADELWEMTLNGVLKSTLGWGTEGNMDEIIRHGKWGLDGLVKFAAYFVEERGVSEGLFEGKLSNLVMVLKQR